MAIPPPPPRPRWTPPGSTVQRTPDPMRPARHLRADPPTAPVAPRSRWRIVLVVLATIVAAPIILIAFLASFNGNR